METYIPITYLNDFVFCPRSIYYHQLFSHYDQRMYHQKAQTVGKLKHESIENQTYSTKKSILQNMDVYSEKYGICGKIDIYDAEKKEIRERKNLIKFIYDGYKYQLYGHYFCLTEMGYEVDSLTLYSLKDNKSYPIPLPNTEESQKFYEIIEQMKSYSLEAPFTQNKNKCEKCIYSSLCDIN